MRIFAIAADVGREHSPQGEVKFRQRLLKGHQMGDFGGKYLSIRPIVRRRTVERIRLLCQSGAGLEAIAAPLCHAARELIGADAASIFWLDAGRNPAGFYHDSAPAALKDMFATELNRFTRPDEMNMVTMTLPAEPSIGRLLDPAVLERFWQGAVYKHLCVPLGHRYLLDMRIDVDGVGRALFCAWNDESRPFVAADVEALRPLQRQISASIDRTREDARWVAVDLGLAHFLTSADGSDLLAINGDAETLLRDGHLLGQNVAMAGRQRAAPGFALQLARMLMQQDTALLHVPVANGRLTARATHSVSAAGRDGGAATMLVVLSMERSADVEAIESLMAVSLSPLQREMALFAVRGGERAECEAEFGVSPEALKKHSRAIYNVLDVARWTDIPRALLRGNDRRK